MDISIVIPAYNEEKYILNSLKSLVNQYLVSKIRYEIIVVDNGSEDGTKQKVLEFINYMENKKKIGEICSNIEISLIEEKRKGVAFARQTGFYNAKGKIIATTDADCITSPLWIKTIHNIFRYNYDYLLAQFSHNFPKRIRKNIIKNNKPIVAATGLIKFYDDDTYELQMINKLIPIFLGLGNFFWLSPVLHGSNFAVLKEAFLKVGGFNTTLKTGEDLDLGLKLSKIGKIVFLPAIVYASSRRFRKNLIKAITIYTFANFLAHRIVGKPLVNELDIARGEKDQIFNLLKNSNIQNFKHFKDKLKEMLQEIKEKINQKVK